MGKKTNTKIKANFLDTVKQNYLDQFKCGDFTKVEFPGLFVYKSIQLFEEQQKFNLIEEVDKTIVCQWFIMKNDWRFENYISTLFVPHRQEDISSIEFLEIFKLISPHNISNSFRLN